MEFKYTLSKSWRVLRKIFGLKGEEATVDWRSLHNDALCDLYTSSNIQFIASRRMDGACGAYRGDERQSYVHGVGGGNPREGHHLEDLSVDGRTTVKWVFNK